MERNKRYFIVAGVVGAAAILLFMYRRDGAIGEAIAAPLGNPFTSPYFADGKQPSQGFVSNVNVNIDTDAFAGLANQYMPVFGFVGVGVTGSLPTSINNIIVNQAPPQRVVQASAPAPTPPIPTAQSSSGWRMVPPSSAPSRGSFGGF